MGAPGAEEGCQRHLALGSPAPERVVRTLILRQVGIEIQVAQAAFGRGSMSARHVRCCTATKTKSSLMKRSMRPAQLALDSSTGQTGKGGMSRPAASATQASWATRLCPWLVMVAGFGCDIELAWTAAGNFHRAKCDVFGVAGALVVRCPTTAGSGPCSRCLKSACS